MGWTSPRDGSCTSHTVHQSRRFPARRIPRDARKAVVETLCIN